MRLKIMGILFFVLAGYILLSYGAHRIVILVSYAELEQTEAMKDVARCMDALRREIHHLDAVAHDWAAWDDTYEFVLAENDRYPKSNLLSQTFADNRINLLYLIDLKRNIIWGEVRDIDSGDILMLPEFSPEGIQNSPKLFSNTDVEEGVSGIVSTGRGPLILSSRPITTSDHTRPVPGFLLMGRFLDRDLVRVLADQTHIRHRYRPAADVPPEVLARLDGSATAPPPVIFDAPDLQTLTARRLVRDIEGRPTLVLEAEIPRTIYQKGVATLRFALVSAGLAGGILLVILMVLMNTIVTRPLQRLTRRVVAIRNAGRTLPSLYQDRRDEIGVLCREFNRMIEQLQEVHSGLAAANERLEHEVQERRQSEAKLLVNQRKLRALSSEMALIEERERRQIAADLHDRIGQNLALAQIRLDMLAASRSSSELEGGLQELRATLDTVIQETRTLTFEISPPLLYEIGIYAAVEWLAEAMASKHGLQISVTGKEAHRTMDDSLRVLIFRAVRELLLNIVKHARARNVSIRMAGTPGAITITVEDDGVGFDPARNDASNGGGGFGLYSIQERFQVMGGAVEIDARPGAGTRVTLTAPTGRPAARIG